MGAAGAAWVKAMMAARTTKMEAVENFMVSLDGRLGSWNIVGCCGDGEKLQSKSRAAFIPCTPLFCWGWWEYCSYLDESCGVGLG